MNNFFIRIYAGLMLAVVVVGLLSYGAVHLLNKHRSVEYREKMARGTFYLTALSLERQDSTEKQNAHLQFLSRLLGADIFLTNPFNRTIFIRHEQALLDEIFN